MTKRRVAAGGRSRGVTVGGVDLGGRHIACALGDARGHILDRERRDLTRGEEPDSVLSWVREAFQRLLRSAGYACVIVTNQSVVGRGMVTDEGVERIHDEMRGRLAEHGAEVDRVYYCPVVPASGDPTVVEHPDRKPAPAALRRDVPLRQVLASVGQSHLMQSYDQLFAWHDIVVAQTLLTPTS